MEERLQKIIASSGMTSRREAEEWIKTGLVRVNGQVVKELGSKADREKDQITVGGSPLVFDPPKITIMVNKPRGYITSLGDPQGRPDVSLLAEQYHERLYPIGRLDFQSEGLLFMTNDGELAFQLTHPRHQIEKAYIVWLDRPLEEEHKILLARGIELDGRKTLPIGIYAIENPQRPGCVWRITLKEGRNRQIRRMFQLFSYKTLRLMRVRIGDVSLGALPVGMSRKLTDHEVLSLKQKANQEHQAPLEHE
jgi:pseudouridine synthase